MHKKQKVKLIDQTKLVDKIPDFFGKAKDKRKMFTSSQDLNRIKYGRYVKYFKNNFQVCLKLHKIHKVLKLVNN